MSCECCIFFFFGYEPRALSCEPQDMGSPRIVHNSSQSSAKLRKGLLSRTKKATKYYKSLYFSISRDYDATLTLQILAIFA